MNRNQQVPYAIMPVNGCDPELFLAGEDGEIVGSERALPKDGLLAASPYAPGKVVRDGVQVELNPHPYQCREALGGELRNCFVALREKLKDTKLTACFRTVVEVKKEELADLSAASRRLGCQKSKNYYDKDSTIKVNVKTYRKRSAAGHIHLGIGDYSNMLAERERLVPLLDILLGNTCVLLDRDPDAAERRKVYGRAGEYRTPAYGLEYRTPSNFWLRDYRLMSFVFGVARLASNVLYRTVMADPQRKGLEPFDAEAALRESVDLDLVHKAINRNDLDLAYENWEGVKRFLTDHVSESASMGLDGTKVKRFETFAKKVQKRGLEAVFPTDPMQSWCTLSTSKGGWEYYLTKRMEEDD